MQVHLHALLDERSRRELRPPLRVVPMVVPDDDAALGGVGDVRQDVCAEALGGRGLAKVRCGGFSKGGM